VLAATLLHELLANLGIRATSPSASPLLGQVGQLTTAVEIEACRASLEEFLRPGGAAGSHAAALQLRKADRSTANDNAAGLRGGWAAIEHLDSVMKAGRHRFVTLFRMSCLDVINQRFGMDAVEDCLMALSAFLTHSLHGDDRIFHWTDSLLLAILLKRPNEQIVTAELQRIANQNRDITINMTGRIVMLRIPLAFELIPIERLHTADEIGRLTGTRPVMAGGR
jgi:GGDEF domain-containing protein